MCGDVSKDATCEHDEERNLPGIREFETFADELVECDGLVFKGQRVVVPAEARAEILQRIHSSHIGINGCLGRAKEAVSSPYDCAQFALKYDFKHVTSSPHYRQGNGRAEAAVKTVKRLYDNAIEDRQDPHLALLRGATPPLSNHSYRQHK